MLKGCSLNMDYKEGIELMNEMKERSDIKMNSITYNTLIDLFVRCNYLENA